MPYDKKKALEILNKLAEEHFDKRDYLKALVYYNKYLDINPKNADVYNTMGYIYRVWQGKYNNIDTQIEYFEKALKYNPKNKFALRNLALTYPLAGKYEEAIECFHKLFKLEPIIDDYLAYAYLKIQLKDFEEGWKYYENRFLRENLIGYPSFSEPKWQGEDISDKILLVHYEQGYGDSIQFCRYLEQVKPLAKKVIFRVQNELLDLMKNSIEGIEIYGMSTPLEELEFDYHIPLMSLLHILKARADNIPMPEGYIKADNERVDYYKKEFFDNDCLKIGISWNGTKFGNKYRDVPLEYFYPLASLANTKIYSFQKGFGYEQLKEVPSDIKIIDLGKTFKDFSDTSAAMANLDLFITSDNGLFNLAGSMGVNTYVLLNKYAEWRWFLDEDTNPWYNSVKVFKKKSYSDSWESLMKRAIKAIQKNKQNQ